MAEKRSCDSAWKDDLYQRVCQRTVSKFGFPTFSFRDSKDQHLGSLWMARTDRLWPSGYGHVLSQLSCWEFSRCTEIVGSSTQSTKNWMQNSTAGTDRADISKNDEKYHLSSSNFDEMWIVSNMFFLDRKTGRIHAFVFLVSFMDSHVSRLPWFDFKKKIKIFLLVGRSKEKDDK